MVKPIEGTLSLTWVFGAQDHLDYPRGLRTRGILHRQIPSWVAELGSESLFWSLSISYLWTTYRVCLERTGSLVVDGVKIGGHTMYVFLLVALLGHQVFCIWNLRLSEHSALRQWSMFVALREIWFKLCAYRRVLVVSWGARWWAGLVKPLVLGDVRLSLKEASFNAKFVRNLLILSAVRQKAFTVAVLAFFITAHRDIWQ